MLKYEPCPALQVPPGGQAVQQQHAWHSGQAKRRWQLAVADAITHNTQVRSCLSLKYAIPSAWEEGQHECAPQSVHEFTDRVWG